MADCAGVGTLTGFNSLMLRRHMFIQFIFYHKRDIAHRANVGFAVHMITNVLRKFGGVFARKSTSAANEGKISTVSLNMRTKIILLIECPTTN